VTQSMDSFKGDDEVARCLDCWPAKSNNVAAKALFFCPEARPGILAYPLS
jgi:hypothetical protein